MFLALEHIFTTTQHDVWGWVVCFWVGRGGKFPFVALARILMLRNMMYLTLDHIFTATQHDVSYTRRHLYCYATWCFLHNLCFTDEKKNLGVLAEIPEIFNLGTTWEHLYINGTLKRKAFRWRWFFTDTQLFLIKTKKQNFGRFWQTDLHLNTLFTMVATWNGNVSSPKKR